MTENELRDAIRALETGAEGREFTDAERDEWNELNGRAEQFERRRARLLELAGKGAVERATFAGSPTRTDDTSPPHIRQAHEDGLRSIERYSDVLEAPAADRLDSLIRNYDPAGLSGRYLAAVGNEHYNSAFGKMISDPTTGHLRFSPQEVEAVREVSEVDRLRSMNVTTGGSGGFAIPFALDPTVMLSSSGALNPVRGLSSVETIGTDVWKGVASDGVTAGFAAEATEASDNSPTLVQPSITTQKAFAFVPFSIELGQDWGSLQQELGKLFADSKDVLEATKFLTGNPSSNEPAGILNIGGTGSLTTTQRVLTSATATFAVGDVYLLKQAVPARFTPGASSTWNPNTLDTIYRFVAEGSTTEPKQMPEGRGGPLLGKPQAEWSTMATGATTGTKLGIWGDFRAGYKIVDRIGGTVEIIPHLFGATNRFPTGQRGAYFYWRVGAAVQVPNALRYLEAK